MLYICCMLLAATVAGKLQQSKHLVTIELDSKII